MLGEGVETVLAAATHIAHRGTLLQPAWAAGDAGHIGAFPALSGVEALTLLVDADENGIGQSRAAECARRWAAAGRQVTRLTPRLVGADFNDLIEVGSLSPFREYPGAFDEAVDDEIGRERIRKGGGNGRNEDRSGKQTHEQWPQPKPLPAGLVPVEPFKSEFLPDALAPWVDDIANRLQCPLDYVAITALTALGAVIGRRIGIKPQVKTDWIEIPNLWGAFIGRPGMLKSPAMGEALKPIHRLESEAAKENEIAQQAYAVGLDAYKLRRAVNKTLVRDKLKENKNAEIDFDLGEEPKEPTPVRYRTNDSTYEGLGELLISNPTGILVERDDRCCR